MDDDKRSDKRNHTTNAGVLSYGTCNQNNTQCNFYIGSHQEQDHAEINYEELIKTVNSNTKEISRRSILAYFKHEGLNDSGCVVHPQMVDIDVNDYYKGRHGLDYTGYTYVLSQHEGHENQSTSKHSIRSEAIEVNNFMESIWKRGGVNPDDAFGITAIIASAGSGKSTLTRRMARKALDILSADYENAYMSHDHQIKKMVHFIDLKEIPEGESITLPQFLFGALASKSDQEHVFTWLVQNQSKAIIFFDGLDQTRWVFDRKNCQKIRNDQRASPSAILYNILARNILRQVKIFIASREFKVSELPIYARPNRIIALNGLTLEEAKTIFISLLQDKGVNLWEKIEAMSPRLLQLVCVPVFLILTAIVMGKDPDRDPPNTVTELYNRIVLNLESVENIRNEQILAIIKNLKEMAFCGMQEGRVVFKEADLDRFGVPAHEVEDLMSKLPGNKLVSSRLLRKDFDFFFCHQSMQEFLAASFIAEMKLDDFSRFDHEHLHGKWWFVVRRFVTGIVYSKSSNELHDVADRKRKQKILCQSIRLQFRNGSSDLSNDDMELFTVINESNNDNLMKQLYEIGVSRENLTLENLHVFGSLIASSRHIQSLDLSGWRPINADDIQIIGKYLQSRIHVLKLITIYLDDLDLRSREGVVDISGEGIVGHFDIRKKTLLFEWFQNFNRFFIAKFVNRLFKPESIKINIPCSDLRRISESMSKVKTLLVNCYEHSNIDWLPIEEFVTKHQVERLEIIADGEATTERYVDLLQHENAISALGVRVNIQWSFYVRKQEDVQSTLKVCQQKNIESIRCVIDWLYRPSLDDITSLLKLFKKLTLLYCSQDDILKGGDLQKVRRTANVLSTELEILCGVNHDTSWQLGIQFQTESTTLDEYEGIELRPTITFDNNISFEYITGPMLQREGEKQVLELMNQAPNFIVTGDGQKEASLVVGDEPGFSLQQKRDINFDKLIKTVNTITKEKTSVRILDDFKDKGLHEPDFAVFPQIVRLDSVHQIFWEFCRHHKNEDLEFDQHSKYKDESIKIKDFMASIWQKREKSEPFKAVDITAIIASAGSGKTTLIRRIAQEALCISSANKKMVHYVELNDITEEKIIKMSKFLFGGIYESETEEDQALEWLLGHQNEAILIFDGFDQTEWIADENSLRRIKSDEPACPSTIMHNILARNTLRHVKIFIASREFKVLALPEKIRPRNIIMLKGFVLQDAKRLFTFLLGEKGEELWDIIEIMSPRLLQLISVPVFLILTAIVMRSRPNRDPTITVTELYNRIISSLQSVQNIRNRKKFFWIIIKLKIVAFTAMATNTLIDEAGLKKIDISTADVQDFLTKVPDVYGYTKGDSVFHFCHQSMQTFLAASYLAAIPFDVFSFIYGGFLHDYSWHEVRRFVSGIVYSESSNILHKVRDRKRKQEFILYSTVAQLVITKEREARLELYAAIDEINDVNLVKNLSVIDVSGIWLSRDEKHMIGSLIAKSGGLRYLGFWSCDIDGDNVAIITKHLKRQIRVDHIDLRQNNLSAETLGSFLGFHRNKIKYLDWKVVRATRAMTNSTPASATKAAISSHNHIRYDGKKITVSACPLKMTKVGAVPIKLTNIRMVPKGKNARATLTPSILAEDGATRPVVMSRHIQLTNEGDVIKIHGEGKEYRGRFHVKESKLVMDRVYWLEHLIYSSRLFDPGFIEIPDELLYATPEDMRKLSETKIEKINKILLDCTEEKNIDWLLIKDSVQKYQVEHLDIVTTGVAVIAWLHDILTIENQLSKLGVRGNLHCMFKVDGADGVNQMLDICQNVKAIFSIRDIACMLRSPSQMGSVRCMVGYDLPADDISRLVKTSSRLTLIYCDETHRLNEQESRKLDWNLREFRTRPEVLCVLNRYRDAWWLLDANHL